MSEFSLLDFVDLPLKRRLDSTGNFSGTSAPPPGVVDPGTDEFRNQIIKKGLTNRRLLPEEPLKEGEQYRFHFDGEKCIGCSCCVVACNEQNNNPPGVNWRRVGEVESGVFPETTRINLSMACNHCLDPGCLKGCPTDSYEKDSVTGIVRHKADSCIGCQYCVWNCPYGVPQFNKERGVVGKCDMCYGRLTRGQDPACADSCPEGAILIEKVNVEEWRKDHTLADSPGMPESDITVSTTRITLPQGVRESGVEAGEFRVEPEHPHTPLIAFLSMTQLAVGGFISLWSFDLFHHFVTPFKFFKEFSGLIAAAMMGIAGLALNTAVFHLGRPAYAWRALKMWKRSWLSREVLLFGVFSGLAAAYSGLWLDQSFLGLLNVPTTPRLLLGALVALVGLMGIMSSACIYMTPARPSWNSPVTLFRFLMTAMILGPMFMSVLLGAGQLFVSISPREHASLLLFLFGILVAGSLGQSGILLNFSSYLSRGNVDRELQATSFLLRQKFWNLFLLRLAGLFLGGILIPLMLAGALLADIQPLLSGAFFGFSLLGFLLALGSEFIGRYLFFVTVVPKNMGGGFFKHG